MIGRFFYLPKARRFNITPRYYDPEQEERDAREKRIKGELGIEDKSVDTGKPYRPNIKGQFRNSSVRKTKTDSAARKTSNRRLIILIAILTLIAYLLFYSDIKFFK